MPITTLLEDLITKESPKMLVKTLNYKIFYSIFIYFYDQDFQ